MSDVIYDKGSSTSNSFCYACCHYKVQHDLIVKHEETATKYEFDSGVQMIHAMFACLLAYKVVQSYKYTYAYAYTISC